MECRDKIFLGGVLENDDDVVGEVCDDGRRDVYQMMCECGCRDEWLISQLVLVMFQLALLCQFHVLEDLYIHSNSMLWIAEPGSHLTVVIIQ